MKGSESRIQTDLTRRYKVIAKINGKPFENISFFSKEIANYWFKQWQKSYKNWVGEYTIELYFNDELTDTATYKGDGTIEASPEPIKPRKKKPFVPQVFPDFEKPHYNCVVGKGTTSEKELYKEPKPEKTTKKTAKKDSKKTTKKTVKKTATKTVKKQTKKTKRVKKTTKK